MTEIESVKKLAKKDPDYKKKRNLIKGTCNAEMGDFDDRKNEMTEGEHLVKTKSLKKTKESATQ